jgi:hypothetical protein
MDKIALVILTALIAVVCIPPTAKILLLRVRIKSKPFRPVYRKRESVLFTGEQNDYARLEPLLERFGMTLLPGVGFQQIVAVKKDLSPAESSQAFSELDGRTVQFLLVETKKLSPLAVVHIGGDGAAQQFPEHFLDGAKFCSALLESVGVPEIVVFDRDMENPERVVSRFQEILREGRAGIINV